MTNKEQVETMPLRFTALVSDSWTAIRDNWIVVVVAGFTRDLVALMAGGLAFTLFVELRGWNLIIAFVVRMLVWSALQTGYLTICLDAAKSNKTNLADLFSRLAMGFQMLVASALFFFAALIGTFFLVIPGIFLGIMFSLYGFVLIDREANAPDSLLGSYKMLGKGGLLAATIIVVAAAVAYFIPIGFEIFLVMSLATLYENIRQREV